MSSPVFLDLKLLGFLTLITQKIAGMTGAYARLHVCMCSHMEPDMTGYDTDMSEGLSTES